jgi:hypothetical protein
MKTLPALGALALLASTCAADARGGKVYEISLDGYCNIYHTQINGAVVAAQDTPSCSGNYGAGLLATVKGAKSAVIALYNSADPGAQLMLELSYPFTDGGTFRLYQTTNGVTVTDALDGTYSLHAAPDEGAKSAAPALQH